jgi:hypothetical protein
MGKAPHDEPSAVRARPGEVLVEGPGSISFSFTPVAALETGERLIHAGVKAQAQLGGRT